MAKNYNPHTQPLIDAELDLEIKELLADYKGDSETLERALGALIISRFYGWHVTRVLHNQATYAKYEKAIGMKYSEVSFAETIYSKKSRIYVWAKKWGKFWDVVRGKYTNPERPPASDIGDMPDDSKSPI